MTAPERDVQRYKDTLEAARHAEPLRAEKAVLEKEQAVIIRDLGAYDEFYAESEHETEWKTELALQWLASDALSECRYERARAGSRPAAA